MKMMLLGSSSLHNLSLVIFYSSSKDDAKSGFFFFCPQKFFVVSHQNSTADFSLTTEVDKICANKTKKYRKWLLTTYLLSSKSVEAPRSQINVK